MSRSQAVSTAQAGSSPFYAGKNKLINGDFYWNQRSFSSTTSSEYGLDRWSSLVTDGTNTYSVQQFTLGTAPVSGYEAKQYARMVTTGQTLSTARSVLLQRIESVRTFAGQSITVSFWAKAASGTPYIACAVTQSFGTGGSPSSNVTTATTKQTLSTSWARYSFNFTVPSISGKTIGTNNNDSFIVEIWFSGGSDRNAITDSMGIQSNTFDVWGVQVEAGSVATAFQTATGTIQGELAAAMRYYYRVDSANAGDTRMNTANMVANSTTVAYGNFAFPVRMRTSPTFGSSTAANWSLGRIAVALTALAQERASQYSSMVKATVASGLTAGNGDWLEVGNNNTSYIEFSAEL